MCDATGAHLNAYMDEFLLIKFMVEQVDAICWISEECDQCVTKENNKRAICLLINKALCGCVQSAFIWHKLLVGTLIDLCFSIIPYDLCVSNANVEVS